jgi:hypothetical protein
MTQAVRKKKSQDAKEEFFLYVAFHAAFSALVNLFKDD